MPINPIYDVTKRANAVTNAIKAAVPVSAKPDPIVSPALPAVVPPPITPAAASPAAPVGKTAFDTQREQVAADKIAEEKRRVSAVERAYSNRGLGDSGILEAGKRQELVAASKDASSRYNSIDTNEAAQAYATAEAEKARNAASAEADKGRAFLGSENAADRAAGKEQFYAGLNQAKDLAVRGLDLQASSLALQEKGMTAENARYYAGLAQADRLAIKGLSLQEQAQELTKQGMAQEDARYYAGLSQARILADKGLTLDDARLKLTEQGMSQEDARYYAGLAANEKAASTQNANDIKKGLIVDAMSKIDPSSPDYTIKIKGLLDSLSLGSIIPGIITKDDVAAAAEAKKRIAANSATDVFKKLLSMF